MFVIVSRGSKLTRKPEKMEENEKGGKGMIKGLMKHHYLNHTVKGKPKISF